MSIKLQKNNMNTRSLQWLTVKPIKGKMWMWIVYTVSEYKWNPHAYTTVIQPMDLFTVSQYKQKETGSVRVCLQ